jgi:hypothetical protein
LAKVLTRLRRELLTRAGAFLINILGVWSLFLVLFLPWGLFLLVYPDTIVGNRLVFNVVGILVGVALHAIVMGYILSRRARMASGGWPQARGGVPSGKSRQAQPPRTT